MDEQRRRIQEDLVGVFDGDVRVDALSVSLSASDGSLYRVTPLGVCFPKHEGDVVTLAKYAHENNIPLIARGAGTGLAGGALGSGLIVDFSRHMRSVESIGSSSVTVQPGVVRNTLNRALKSHGRYFAPDPALADVTTIGGMIGVDAAGSHAVRVGSTRDHVIGLRLVLGDGTVIEAGQESLDMLRPSDEPQPPDTPEGFEESLRISLQRAGDRKREIVSKLVGMLAEHRELIDAQQPALIRNCCGYFLRNILTDSHLHLQRLLVGSEGTLGLVTQAMLNTTPLASSRGVALLLFGRLEEAVNAVRSLVGLQPSACDLLDRRLLSLAREADPRFEAMIPSAAEAALLIEQTGFSEAGVQARLGSMIRAARESARHLIVAAETYAAPEVEFLWSLPHKVTPLLTRLEGVSRPQPFVEDIAVPPEAIHEFLIRSQKVFQKHEVTASLYAHAASGQVHLRPFLPTPTPADGARLEAIARDLYQAVFALGGSISGEHGDGFSRTSFIRSQYGPLYRLFQQVKEIFDPHNILNPGKIVSDDPHLTVEHLRPAPVPDAELIPLQLTWDKHEFAQAIDRCNSCGQCKTHAPSLRMCPFHRIDPHEETSPRSKVNVLRDHLAGLLDTEEVTGEEMRRLTSSCFNCKQCQLECTSHVDVPGMVVEAKAAYVATNGLGGTDWFLSRAHSFGRLGTGFSLLSNWLLSSPFARWVFEKMFGLARRRKVPSFSRRPFLRSMSPELSRAPDRVRSTKGVLYFVDHYANYHDPLLARCLVSILRHNGYQVYVPPEQTGSGMAMISAGDLEAAKEVAEWNVRLFADYAREGWTILCSEPAAALCLSQEYPRLIEHADVQTIADSVRDAGAFLLDMHERGELRTDFSPLPFVAGYHTPCHLKALGKRRPLRELVGLIPKLDVRDIEKGCSGMAGAFGLSAEHFETSLEIGAPLIERMGEGDLHIGLTECSSCKVQMEQGTPTATVHPLKLLAFAYGLAPEVEKSLKPSKNPLLTT